MRGFLIALACLLLPGSTYTLESGDEAPKFINLDISRQYVYSKDILGAGWVILDFFATDCEPCKKELLALEKIYSEYSDRGIKIFIMATDQEGISVVRPYFSEQPTGLTVLIDRYRITAKKYGVSEIPTLFLIGETGMIVFKGEGYSEEIIRDVREILDGIFGEQKG